MSDTEILEYSDDVSYRTVRQISKLFEERVVSPSEYLGLLFAKIETDNRNDYPINAFTDLFYEEARGEARAADRYFWGGGRAVGENLLRGIPIAVKEAHALKGQSVDGALRIKHRTPAMSSQPMVERLRQAGAFVHGRTTTPQLSCVAFTHSERWGSTLNPWDRECSPGGSTGGGAAALAAGFTPLATASDIGGSTRIPAGFTGTVGYKGPYGVIPSTGAAASDWYYTDGSIARSVADVALMTNLARGVHTQDHSSIPSPYIEIPSPNVGVDSLRGKRILYAPNLGNYPVEPSVRSTLDQAMIRFEDAGAHVKEITMPLDNYEIWRITMAHTGHFSAEGMRRSLEVTCGSAEDYVLRCLEDAAESSDELSMLHVIESERRIQNIISTFLDSTDVLIAPVSGVLKLAAGNSYLDGLYVDAGSGNQLHIHRLMMAIMTKPFNIANRCPVMSIPAGHKDGFPVGMQIVGSAHDEQSVFDVAAGYEELMGGNDWPTLC